MEKDITDSLFMRTGPNKRSFQRLAGKLAV